MSAPRVIYWFRTDLRLHDSPALASALSLQPSHLFPIFTWDPHYVHTSLSGPNRWQFMLDCMSDLSSSISSLNPKSRLLVLREAPQTLLPKLFREWNITHLVFEKDTDAYARDRDQEVISLAKEAGVEVITKAGRTLWDSDEIVRVNGGKPTMSIREVQKAGDKLGPIPRPLPAPTEFPDLGDTTSSFAPKGPMQDPAYSVFVSQQENRQKTDTSGIAGPNHDFAIPTFSELNFSTPPTTPHHGGENLALEALTTLLQNPTYISSFSKPNTAPTDFLPQSTTLLSPHLHFGSLGIREFYWRVQHTITTYASTLQSSGQPPTDQISKPPTNLTSQLVFRDMYFAAQCALGQNFSQAYNNPRCRFIPWHLPSKLDPSTGLRPPGEYQIDDKKAEEYFQRWAHGTTGFPLVDAFMRQLKEEGWIHHLGRHLVACFLTRGGCYVDWERGADVFAHSLIDHEEASNIGNWQWLSCTAFFTQYHRVYSPTAFGKKWDPAGTFVKHYIPALAKYPPKYIYEPWKAPLADQRAWGCMVTGDGGGSGEPKEGRYPKPMFDFASQKEICMRGMKNGYYVGLFGNNQKVLDGSWRALFPDDAEGADGGCEWTARCNGRRKIRIVRTRGRE